MRLTHVPAILRKQLGEEATTGLIELLDAERGEWSDDVLTIAAERFDRRLTEEVSKLRVDFAQAESRLRSEFRQELQNGRDALRQELLDSRDALRQELRDGDNALRQELRDGLVGVRKELQDGLTSVSGELADTRVELLKWSFLFWVGQVAAVAGLLAFMLRASGR